MARIAGINIPMNKHVVIGLTHIYGVGRDAGARHSRQRRHRAEHTREGFDRGRGRRDPLADRQDTRSRATCAAKCR